MDAYNPSEPWLGSRRATPRPPAPVTEPPRSQRTQTPGADRGRRLALASDFDSDIPPVRSLSAHDDFSDLKDNRLEDLERERRPRIWFFKVVGALAIAATAVVLVGMTANPGVRRALSSWATFGIVQ